MKQYERGDIATYYFVIMSDDGKKIIKGWTDSKQLAKFYMDFHKCPSFHMKALTKPIEDFTEILNENRLDEIKIHRIKIRDPNGSKKKPLRMVEVPMTETEASLIRDAKSDLMGLRIEYNLLHEMMPYLKGYYRKGLEMIMLPEAIRFAIYNQVAPMWKDCELDELRLLFASNPEIFGI